MSCVLRIMGENFDVDVFVEKTQMSGFNKWYKGDPLGMSANRKKKYSGASITTSFADFDDVKSQIEDTIRFLNEHKHNLKIIASTPNIEYAMIDFGVNSIIDDEHLTQSFYFTKDLIRICAELDIAIELSIYKEDMQVILERNYQKKQLGQ
jgi:hypothetical protein